MKRSPKRTAEPVRRLSVDQLVGAPVKVVATIEIVRADDEEHVIVSHAPGKRVMWWTGTRLGWASDPMIAHRYDNRARAEKALTGLRLRKQASHQRVQEVIPARLIDRFEGEQ